MLHAVLGRLHCRLGTCGSVWPDTLLRRQVSNQGGWMRNTLRSPKAHVYICGDSLMANAVTASLTQVIGTLPMPPGRNLSCWHAEKLVAWTSRNTTDRQPNEKAKS